MQDETALDLNRATKQYRFTGRRHIASTDLERQLEPLEQHTHGHIGRSVNDHAQCPVAIVLTKVDHGATKYRVEHGRHRDQKVIGEL